MPDVPASAADGCPHCPDGHKRPDRQPWSAWVSEARDGDGQPMTIHVARSNGAHVAESDAQWIREQLNDRPRGLPSITDGITGAEAEASAMFDMTIGEIRALKTERDAATARAEQAEAERDDTQRRFDALVTSDKAKQGAADWLLNRLHGGRLIDDGTYTSLCGLLRDQIDATRFLTHSEDWGPLTDRYRAAVKRAKDAEAEVERLRRELADARRDHEEIVEALKEQRDETHDLADRNEQLRDERDGHRHRQVEAERALILLLLREEGARVEFTAAEMIRAPQDGSFVSSRTVAGSEVLEFRAARPVRDDDRCPCGCPKTGPGCDCHWCNEPTNAEAAEQAAPMVLPNESFDALAESMDAPAQAVPELVDLFRRPRITPPADSDIERDGDRREGDDDA